MAKRDPKPKKPNPAAAQAACDAWNAAHEVGAEVAVARDSGERKETITRGEAFVAESGHAVIMVVGISGYYLLDRVTAGHDEDDGFDVLEAESQS